MSVRDLLMQVALTDLFRAKWTEAILDEWVSSLLAQRPDLSPTALARTRRLMNAHAEGCLITGYEPLIEGLALPDPDDRHVLAAAIAGRADVIVTYNLRDFPEDTLRPHGIEAMHPDGFLHYVFEMAPGEVVDAARRCRLRKTKPPYTVEDYLNTLERRGLTRLVSGMRGFADLL
jgi:predicted nucleic acid-binding protein